MCLTGTALLPRIKECEQSIWPVVIDLCLGAAASIHVPRSKAFVSGFQVCFFKEVGLGFPFCGCEEEVVWYDREFVEDEGVGGVLWRETRKQEFWRWVFERVEFWLGAGLWFQVGGLLCQCWAVTQLKLCQS